MVPIETRKQFLAKAVQAADTAMHPFPEFAACEAALESAFGTSELACRANNLFGQKYPHANPGFNYPGILLPTHEWERGEMVRVADVLWPRFPDWVASFRQRVLLLERLAPSCPHYQYGLEAADGEGFVRLMSPCEPQPCHFTHEDCVTWASDPKRADNVLAIYAQFFGALRTDTGGTATPAS